MSTLTATPIIGLELIQREALLVLYKDLNNIIEEFETNMETSDQRFAQLTGQEFYPTTINRIDNENFYEGHHPSLINAPLSKYPNCSAWAVQAAPGPESDQFDQMNVYTNTLYVEVMVKASPEEGETAVNRRVQRTAEAVNVCLLREPTLNGIVTGLNTSPTVRLSDVFTRKSGKGHGQTWFWQGARLEYAVRKEATIPSISPGSIFDNAPTGHFGDIDQA